MARGIRSLHIDGSGHLIVEYTDLTSEDVGLVAGVNGITPAFQIGTVTALAPNSVPSVVISGLSTPETVILDFGIPSPFATNLNDTFRAKKTIEQLYTGPTKTIAIAFEQKIGSGCFDTNNLFFQDKYVASRNTAKMFAAELVKINDDGTNWDATTTAKLQIRKNGVMIAESAVIDKDSVDIYGKKISADHEYTFSVLVSTHEALVSEDEVEAVVVFTTTPDASCNVKIDSIFSNS